MDQVTDMAVTTDDIRCYQRDGAVLIKRALSAPELRLLETGVEETYRAGSTRDKRLVPAGGGGETMVRDYALNDSPSLTALLATGTLGRIAATLMGTESAQVVLDQVFYKARGAVVPTPWHQDTPFLRVRGDQLIRLWCSCDASPAALTVQVVRGSHRWNVVYNTSGIEKTAPATMAPTGGGAPAGEGPIGDSWLPPPPDVRRYRDSFDIMGWDVAPGDVLAFQGNMLHGTDGHPGHDRPRRAFAILMGGPDLRFHVPDGNAFPSPGRAAGAIGKEDIPNGAPIGDYPAAFPFC